MRYSDDDFLNAMAEALVKAGFDEGLAGTIGTTPQNDENGDYVVYTLDEELIATIPAAVLDPVFDLVYQ